MDPETLSYMTTPLLFQGHFIPLWHPSPLAQDPRRWRWNVCIGDVGYFTRNGGFRTLFNVLQTAAQNIDRGYDPPDGFIPYALRANSIELDRQTPKWDHEIVQNVGFTKENW